MNKYHIITYGCQMNKSDSERIASFWESQGLKKSGLLEANFIFLNLCSVRQSAIDRVWGKINEITKLRNYENKKIIILTGCILPEDKKKFKSRVDYILDINELTKWPNIINNEAMKKCGNKKEDYFSIKPSRNSKFSALIPIMTGCDNYCSYCVVPYVRGSERSRNVQDIYDEMNKLVVQGYKMITLLGQNVNSYNSRIKARIKSNDSRIINFPILLKILDSIPGNYWLTFITSHPKDLSDNLINCFKTCEHLMPYLHLPIQSGSDRILKKMNRKYTAAHYLKLIKKVRKAKPDISISTDIIVGFPGETQKDFNETLELMKKVKFDMAYIAQYSVRSGTAAAKLKDYVAREEKKKREKILTEILRKTVLENNKKMVGKIVDVLIEASLHQEMRGLTRNFKHVKINVAPSFSSELISEFVKVKITKAGAWGLEGKLVN